MDSIALLWTTLIGLLIVLWYVASYFEGKMDRVLLPLVTVIFFIGGFATYKLTGTASFQRSMKDWRSEFNQDIYREVVVYSRAGDIIYEEIGRFDVDYSNDRLKWVNEEGRVQIIYLGDSATAVVSELEEVAE